MGIGIKEKAKRGDRSKKINIDQSPITNPQSPAVIIVSGLSGSGKTVALRALEDSGFFCADNLPVTLLGRFIAHLVKKGDIKKIGIGIDIREQPFLSMISTSLLPLKKKYNTEIIFLEAEKGVLIRRFKETRRPHPLSLSGKNDIEGSIEEEKKMLAPLRKDADRIIDTSSYTPHQLRNMIVTLYEVSSRKKSMSLTLISFGYKYSIPQNLDLLFDVRFLPNPHFVPELKDLTGADRPVRRFLFEKKDTKEFIRKMRSLLNFLIPRYIKEGKTYLTIGIGCTGGRHRSPAIAEKIAAILKRQPVDINIIHREL